MPIVIHKEQFSSRKVTIAEYQEFQISLETKISSFQGSNAPNRHQVNQY